MTLPTPAPNLLRDSLTEMITNDLLGPSGGLEEELDQREDHVYQRYLVGMLAPKALEIAGEEMDELAEAIREDRRKGNPRPNGHLLLKEIRARKATRH